MSVWAMQERDVEADQDMEEEGSKGGRRASRSIDNGSS